MIKMEKATQPTIYFIGVTTGQSSIMKVFPKWAKTIGLDDAVIKGIDIEIHANPEVYREVVSFIKNDPLSMGALVTTHKIDIYNAAKDLFDYLDPYAQMFGNFHQSLKEMANLEAMPRILFPAGCRWKVSFLKGFGKNMVEKYL